MAADTASEIRSADGSNKPCHGSWQLDCDWHGLDLSHKMHGYGGFGSVSEVGTQKSVDAIGINDNTLHQRIVSDIEQKIVSGAWPVGYRIPFEVDLAKHYGCSRMTVNKAMTQLARANLIDRIKRSGSFVCQPHTQSAVLEINEVRKEVESLKLPYTFSITKRALRKARRADRARLDVPVSASILELTCLHMAGGHPFCVEERLINIDSVPKAATADFRARRSTCFFMVHVSPEG